MSDLEPLLPSHTPSTSAVTKQLIGLANLIKRLPTGTVFFFYFLNPIVTNNGHCQTANQHLGAMLIAACGFSCFFSSFTDSYVDKDGVTLYGVVTNKGLWPYSDEENLSAYKLQIGDFVHAFFSLFVFGVIVLLNPYSVQCYYPPFESSQKLLLMVLPPAVGTISGCVFVSFPNKRHGIGYAISQALETSSFDQ